MRTLARVNWRGPNRTDWHYSADRVRRPASGVPKSCASCGATFLVPSPISRRKLCHACRTGRKAA